MICGSAYEILFSDMISGAQVTDGASKLLEMEWHTWTCTLGSKNVEKSL